MGKQDQEAERSESMEGDSGIFWDVSSKIK